MMKFNIGLTKIKKPENKKMLLIMCAVAIVFMALLIKTCSKPQTSMANSPMQEHKAQATLSAPQKSLFFTGTIKPLQESALVSPVDAVIAKMEFHYGQMIDRGAVIFTLNSSELQHQYQETLTEYLKAKDSYNVTRAKFSGTEDLWKAGLIAKNNYLSEKSSLDMARIGLMQSSTKLAELLKKVDESKTLDLDQLSLAEFDKVSQILSVQHNLIQVRAEARGLLLYPPKSSDDKSGNLGIGAAVKAGQVLALLGDLDGIRIEIDVPEIDVQKIKPGMKALITGIALSGKPLIGKLVNINAQAFSTGGNALPSFSALVEVKYLSEETRAKVRVGMSAAIELVVEAEDKLQIPLAAVHLSHGQKLVLLENKDGTRSSKSIITGGTYRDTITVESGLKAGDVVVYDR